MSGVEGRIGGVKNEEMSRKRDVARFQKNPFFEQLSGMKTRAKRVTARGGKAIIDVETGELEDVAEIVSVHQVDNAQFVKVFTSNLKQFFNLRPTAFRMVQVLLYQLGKMRDRDQVYLNMSLAERYFTATGQKPVSSTAYYTAIKEMIEKGFIAESPDQGLYWINPTLFFNGDRVRFVKEYRNTQWKQRDMQLDERVDGRNPFIADDRSSKAEGE